jgi:CRP/FNR family transcriptional regulator
MVTAGATILPEQKPNGKLFTLYSGWAFRYKTLSDGRRQILNFLLPGDFIGLQQKVRRRCHARHRGRDRCQPLRVSARGPVGAVPQFPQPGLRHHLAGAAREEGIVDDHLLTAGRRNATERVAMLLMHLFRRLERVGMAAGGMIEFPINQQHIADALGLSLVHTNKTLKAPAPAGPARDRKRQAAAAQYPRAGAHCRLLRHAASAGSLALAPHVFRLGPGM